MTTLAVFDTVYPADTVEFCPHPNALDVLVCGTYLLDTTTTTAAQGSPKRLGKCFLLEVSPAANDSEVACASDGARVDDGQRPGTLHLRTLQEVALPAVPDVRWCHMSSAVDPVLAIADSEGSVTLFKLLQDPRRIVEIDSIRCASADNLCLSLDWSNRRTPSTDPGSLIVSLSNGALALLRPNDQHGLTLTDHWHAHDHEPWTATWNYWNSNVVYSGGDDLSMKGWDVRSSPASPIFVNRRFDAGVTCIQSHPHVEHLLAVGSYDDSVRLFDARKPLAPLVCVAVGGGAWRVKWHPSAARKNDLLVACMHDGFKAVEVSEAGLGSEASFDSARVVVQRFDEHESLAYGVDWAHETMRSGGKTLVASCSFYDHALRLWTA